MCCLKRQRTVKGVKNLVHSGCGPVVLVQEAAEVVAALDVEVSRGRRRLRFRRLEYQSAVGPLAVVGVDP